MYMYLSAVLLLLTNFVFAAEECKITSVKDFYAQIKSKGPMLEAISARKEQVKARIDKVGQRPNPEFAFEYLKGDQFGININRYSVSAKHVLEFGSKRDKRIQKAKSFVDYNTNSLHLENFKVNIESTISFQRIAQLDITIDSVKEAIHVFKNVIKKLSSRKRLNPEETVSLSTINLAFNDYQSKLNDLQNERDILEGQISFLSGCTRINPKYSNLNYVKLKVIDKSKKSGLIKLEQLRVELAKSEYEIEKSLGYSNILIGPVLEYQTQGKEEFVSGGISVTFDLPLFQTNNGGKLEASKNLGAQAIESRNNISLLKIKRNRLVNKYNRSLLTLKKMLRLDQLEKQHQKVEKLFARGLVSISMTIESHRQLIDFLSSRFETENDLLDTYGKITLIDGDLESFKSLL